MFAGRIIVPLAISLRTSSAEIFSFCATKAISSVIRLFRAKCIWLMFQSPVRAASSLALHDPAGASGRYVIVVADRVAVAAEMHVAVPHKPVFCTAHAPNLLQRCVI